MLHHDHDKIQYNFVVCFFSGLINYAGEFCFDVGSEEVEPEWDDIDESGFNEWSVNKNQNQKSIIVCRDSKLF